MPRGREDSWVPWAFAALGFVPIGALCLALFGAVPLHLSARLVVPPAAAGAIALGLRFPRWGRVAWRGFLAGVVATAAYDATRLSLVWAGVWPDFIPPIGRLALADPGAHPFWGYLWRFVGNGGGMGLAFAMGPRRDARSGMAYGMAICFCLYGTLLLAPGAQERLFPLSVATALAAAVGHLDYGAVLGWLAGRWVRKPAARALEGVVQAAPLPRDEGAQAAG
jgi:hypothetical protein